VRGLRRAFPEALSGQAVARFKFGDETSVHLPDTRRYGRALGGRRVDQPVPLPSGPHVPVIAARTPQGVEAVMEREGAVHAAAVAVYLDQVLGPTLVPGEVVVLDHLTGHKAPGRAELVEKRGARRLCRPPYSPDFTPVEWAFSKLKTFLRTAQARTREYRTAAVRAGLDWLNQDDAQNWFHHCRYHLHGLRICSKFQLCPQGRGQPASPEKEYHLILESGCQRVFPHSACG